MSRYSAFAIHLGISSLIFIVLTYLVVFEWYPGIFFDSDGGWRGMRIIIAVDLVLGPLLTLIVFKAGKPGLKFDMTAIALLQFICLSAGTYVVYSERPLALVFSDGRFSVMNKKDYIDAGHEQPPNLKNFPGDSPKWVMVALPDSIEDEADLRRDIFQAGQLVSSASDLYVPFVTSGDDFFAEAQDIEVVLAGPGWQPRVDKWLAEQDRKLEDYAFFTFSTRFVIGYLIYDRTTRERVGILTNDT
jgi:hypothetical protein